MNLASVEKMIKSQYAGRSELGLQDRRRFKRGFESKIRKSKVQPGETLRCAFHLGLAFPFDPMTGSQEEFDNDYKYMISASSVEDMVVYFKQQMRANKDLHAFYADLGNMKPEEYDVSKDELTEQDKKVFWSYRCILHYNATVYNVRFKELGKFGRKILCQAVLDEFGQPEQKDALYRIYELEEALHWQRVADIKAEYETGSKKGKPADQMNAEIKASRAMMKVTNPYNLGVTRFIELPMKDGQITDEAIKDLKSKSFGKYEKYIGCPKGDLETYESYLGGKYDTNWNYLEIEIIYQPCADKTGTEQKLESYKTRQLQERIAKEDRIEAFVPNFNKDYREYREDSEKFSDKVILTSVREFGKMDDSAVYSHYKSCLSERKSELTQEIVDRFGSLIETVSEELNEGLLESSMDGTLKEGNSKDGKDLEVDFKETEEGEGNGISVVDEDEVKLVDEDSIESLMEG